MNPTVTNLYEALVRDPNDIALRMVYADALEEFDNGAYPGRLRAEFIRTQIALTQLGPPPKSYSMEQVDTFNFRKGNGTCYVEGIPDLRVGERIDITLSEEERDIRSDPRDVPRRVYEHQTRNKEMYQLKAFWPGCLVTNILWTSPHDYRYEIEFKVDDGSVSWTGRPLATRLAEMFQHERARGIAPMVGDGVWFCIAPGPPLHLAQTHPERWRFAWRNGFPDLISCSVTDWESYGIEIVRAGPIRTVSLTGAISSSNERVHITVPDPMFAYVNLHNTIPDGPDYLDALKRRVVDGALAWARAEAGLPSL